MDSSARVGKAIDSSLTLRRRFLHDYSLPCAVIARRGRGWMWTRAVARRVIMENERLPCGCVLNVLC